MKRKLMLTGSILGVVGSALLSIIYLISLFISFETLTADGFTVEEIIVADVMIAMLAISAILSLVFNILSISQSSKPLGGLKKGILITGLVFDIIVCVDALSFMNVVVMLLALLVLSCGSLKLADICLEKKRVEEDKLAQADNENETQDQPVEESLEEKLVRLDNMRKEGLIDDEEFSLLKKDLINKELSK